MSAERSNAVTLKGKPFTLLGPEVKMGQAAPDFTVLGADLSPLSLSSAAGKTRLLVSVPSLDTPVCDAETRRFNQEAAKIGTGVQVWVISVDLPFAQSRFCTTNGIQNVKALSDHRETSFGLAYGTLIKELRLLSRAIFVVDSSDRLSYVEYVPEVGSHPDYDAALQAVAQGVRA